mmetsp:Transcript_29811/g.78208  ORF Transcript_29811/g.78208 Transcript_29811/m.78208 type:complete len:439 (+) Transcript_29811:2941-4257(+)
MEEGANVGEHGISLEVRLGVLQFVSSHVHRGVLEHAEGHVLDHLDRHPEHIGREADVVTQERVVDGRVDEWLLCAPRVECRPLPGLGCRVVCRQRWYHKVLDLVQVPPVGVVARVGPGAARKAQHLLLPKLGRVLDRLAGPVRPRVVLRDHGVLVGPIQRVTTRTPLHRGHPVRVPPLVLVPSLPLVRQVPLRRPLVVRPGIPLRRGLEHVDEAPQVQRVPFSPRELGPRDHWHRRPEAVHVKEDHLVRDGAPLPRLGLHPRKRAVVNQVPPHRRREHQGAPGEPRHRDEDFKCHPNVVEPAAVSEKGHVLPRFLSGRLAANVSGVLVPVVHSAGHVRKIVLGSHRSGHFVMRLLCLVPCRLAGASPFLWAVFERSPAYPGGVGLELGLPLHLPPAHPATRLVVLLLGWTANKDVHGIDAEAQHSQPRHRRHPSWEHG